MCTSHVTTRKYFLCKMSSVKDQGSDAKETPTSRGTFSKGTEDLRENKKCYMTFLYVFVCVCVYVSVCTYNIICIYMHIYIYIYMYIYVYTYIYIYVYI